MSVAPGLLARTALSVRRPLAAAHAGLPFSGRVQVRRLVGGRRRRARRGLLLVPRGRDAWKTALPPTMTIDVDAVAVPVAGVALRLSRANTACPLDSASPCRGVVAARPRS